VAGRTRGAIKAGRYDAVLVDLRCRASDDGSARIVLTARLKVTSSPDPDRKALVGRHFVSELVVDGDGEAPGDIGRERLMKWASWIKSRGWMVGTA